jgi:hypothetical protein
MQTSSLIANFFPQKQKLKSKKWSDFGGFQLPEGIFKNSKNCQMCVFSLQFVAKNIEGWLKICTS